MTFTLTSFTYLVAEKDMPCDAFRVWVDSVGMFDLKQKEKGIGTWSKAWKGISAGEQYLEYTFEVVDEETGELTEQVLSCRIDMNKVMVKNNLYPPIIQQAFKNYKA